MGDKLKRPSEIMAEAQGLLSDYAALLTSLHMHLGISDYGVKRDQIARCMEQLALQQAKLVNKTL